MCKNQPQKLPFYEFFAGGGLARIGLGSRWKCLFANDIDVKKAASYKLNFAPANELHIGDVAKVSVDMLPGQPVLAWASFPCQDLSLAGNGDGIDAARSGAFWPFWRLIKEMKLDGRTIPIIAIENVVGLLTSNQYKDFSKLCSALAEVDYRFGAMVINANQFVPQSRPRVFIIAIQSKYVIPSQIISKKIQNHWHPDTLVQAFNSLTSEVKKNWIWWNLPIPKQHNVQLIDIIEENPKDVSWHSPDETQKLLDMMTPRNISKVESAKRMGIRVVGTIYKRTRDGQQRAEVRFDGIAGCLRTPAGGSSRQILIFVEGEKVKSRLLSIREAARIMGLNDAYILPEKYNEGYHLIGDAVSVPVVAHLEKHILYPLAEQIYYENTSVLPVKGGRYTQHGTEATQVNYAMR